MMKRGFTLVEMMISVVIFMLAITIAITSVVTSSSIITRTDQRSLVAESARSIVSFISREIANADPSTTKVYKDNAGLSFGVYIPEIREYVCLAIGPGMIGSGYGLVGDIGSFENEYYGFNTTDNIVDAYDFMANWSNKREGVKSYIDGINQKEKNDPGSVDPDGSEYAFIIGSDGVPTNTYIDINETGHPTKNFKNSRLYYWDTVNKEFKWMGDTNGDGISNDVDYNNIVMNWGTKYDGQNTQSISFRKDGTTLIVNAYQDDESNICSPGETTVKTLYKGPLHDSNSIKLSSFVASFNNICYKKADGTGDCASTKTSGKPVKKYETLRLSVQFEEILPKQSKVAEQKKAKTQISTSVPVGVE